MDFRSYVKLSFLEGILLTNESEDFIDEEVDLVLNSFSPFWGASNLKRSHKLPIAHKQGRFFIHKEGLKRLQDESRIWLRYKKNPNGSLNNIAGILNSKKNVAGLMPHPERAVFSWSKSSQDGTLYFEALKSLLS